MKSLRGLFLFVLAAPVFALAANGVGNGVDKDGDMCEQRIQVIRGDLSSWILKDGSAGLQLPNRLAHKQYNQGMLQGIREAIVSCTDETLKIGNVETSCTGFTDRVGTQFITCNGKRFMNTSESDQYVLVHHEFAGLAGFELNTNEPSDYEISNQITGLLISQKNKKLGL